MFVDKSLINGVVFVEDVHATEVVVVKESADDLLVDPGIIGYFDLGFIRHPLLVIVSQGFLLVDTKSHNIREPAGEVPSNPKIFSCTVTGVGQSFNNKGSICVQSDTTTGQSKMIWNSS